MNETNRIDITTIGNVNWKEIYTTLDLDDIPMKISKNQLRSFILSILKEKGLIQEDNQ